MARKRNAGEGSIFQRADGRWCGQLDLGRQGGKRQRKHFYAATCEEVQNQLLKARGGSLKDLRSRLGNRALRSSLTAGLRIRSSRAYGRLRTSSIFNTLGSICHPLSAGTDFPSCLPNTSKRS